MTARVLAPTLSHSGATLSRSRSAVGRRFALWSVNALLVLSVIPWRSDSIFSGGIDPVVAGKALVAVAALAGAAGIAHSTRALSAVGLGPAFLVVVGLLVSALGATVGGDPVATFVLIIRMILVLATILLLTVSTTWEDAVRNLLGAMGVVAVFGAVTGIPEALAEGRLGGGVPELHPNGLAGLASTPLIGAVAVMLHRGLALRPAVAAGALFGIIIATGSRTALLAVGIAVVVAALVNGIRDRKIVYLLVGSVPFLYALAAFTSIFNEIATRAGSTDVTSSLDSRFDAWQAVLAWSWMSWQKWIGLGLSVKTVDVDMRWHDEQVLDSSWVSILAQVGVFGVLVVGLLVVWCVIAAWSSSARRWMVLPLLVLVLLRSITESGLFDSAEPFVVLMLLAAVLTRRSRNDVAHGSPGSIGRRRPPGSPTDDEPLSALRRRGWRGGES